MYLKSFRKEACFRAYQVAVVVLLQDGHELEGGEGAADLFMPALPPPTGADAAGMPSSRTKP